MVATGVSLTLVNVFGALYGERTNGRIALEAATTYAVSLVAFANEYAFPPAVLDFCYRERRCSCFSVF